MERSLSTPFESKFSKEPPYQITTPFHKATKESEAAKETCQAQALQQIQPYIFSSQQSPSIFDKYLMILKSKIFKRKIILFIMNILLSITALAFTICFIVERNRSDQSQSDFKIQQIFNTQFSLLTLFFIVGIALISAIFAIMIIKGKVIMLHCFWITCLLFLVIFSIVCASTFSLTSMDCQEPSSYILQKIKMTSNLASDLFCSDICPCNRPQYKWINGITLAEKVQNCPGWNEAIYSSFLSTIQENFKCSGWCSINPKSYFIFSENIQKLELESQISCFDFIRSKIESDTSFLRIFSVILCSMLILIIFYTNYYIFMEKEDENRQVKKMKRKMKETQQIMEDELKTSKRMLE